MAGWSFCGACLNRMGNQLFALFIMYIWFSVHRNASKRTEPMLASNVYANWLNKLVLLTPLQHAGVTHTKIVFNEKFVYFERSLILVIGFCAHLSSPETRKIDVCHSTAVNIIAAWLLPNIFMSGTWLEWNDKHNTNIYHCPASSTALQNLAFELRSKNNVTNIKDDNDLTWWTRKKNRKYDK